MLAVFGLEWRGSACPSSRPPVKLFSVSQGELRVDCDGGEDAAAWAYGLGSFAQHHRGEPSVSCHYYVLLGEPRRDGAGQRSPGHKPTRPHLLHHHNRRGARPATRLTTSPADGRKAVSYTHLRAH